jgi:uncharacterized protein YigA (DUF484 family)
MSKQPSSNSDNNSKAELSEQEVISYLEQHPDLLLKHQGLLEKMQVPHGTGSGMVSLIERQVQLLREKNRLQEDRLLTLVNNARTNEELSEKLHRYSLLLSTTGGLEELLQGAAESLQQHFDIDAVSVHIKPEYQSDDLQASELSDKTYSAIMDTLGNDSCSCHSELDDELTAALFGDKSSTIKSCALLALDAPHRIGLIALGSSEQDRFSPHMGTLILSRLGEQFSAALLRHHDF